MKIFICDAFSSEIFKGNQAGVVILEEKEEYLLAEDFAEAYKKAGQEQQVKIYEDQKKQSMDQLAALPKEQQDATCKQAKEMFAQVMEQMKKQGLLK